MMRHVYSYIELLQIHLHFGTSLKTCRGIPGIYRLKIVRLSSTKFSLIMKKFIFGFKNISIFSVVFDFLFHTDFFSGSLSLMFC